MKSIFGRWRKNAKLYLVVLVFLASLGLLLLYKLGSLVGGLSKTELVSATQAVGWHGIYVNPLDLPVKILRSIVFFLSPDHGQTLTRLPNAFMGGTTIVIFGCLTWLWHGRRTALLTTLLFATNAWTLHTARFASFDIQYAWAVLMLLLVQVALHKFSDKPLAWYAYLITLGLVLYIPGMVWLIIIQAITQRSLIAKASRSIKSWYQILLSVLVMVIWLPLLAIELLRSGGFTRWLGLPADLPSIYTYLKQLGTVFINLFVSGPLDRELWLGQAPILDIFTLIVVGLGAYFYIKRWRAARSQTLGLFFIVGVILVSLGGPVSLSLPITLLYVVAAAGIAYLLHDWLKTFPLNPLARGLGIGLVAVAIALSCLYNLRAYFVAWPHHPATPPTFRYHR